jgi:hypothetical protein
MAYTINIWIEIKKIVNSNSLLKTIVKFEAPLWKKIDQNHKFEDLIKFKYSSSIRAAID